jgi:hypothetical protein
MLPNNPQRRRRTRLAASNAERIRQAENNRRLARVVDACARPLLEAASRDLLTQTAEQAPSPKGTCSYTSAFLGDLSGSTNRP